MATATSEEKDVYNVDPTPDGSIGTCFRPVFNAELGDIACRRGIDTDKNDAADCPFEFPIIEKKGLSESLKAVLGEVTSNTQNELWSAAGKNDECKSGLTGLALSGGGIRSSTFNLGVLQAMNRSGLLQHMDYMSTVSGGGYVGTYLSTSILEDIESSDSLRLDAGADTEPAADEPTDNKNDDWFPFGHETGATESARFRHLRNYASFLTPGGKSELLSIPLVLLRGAVANCMSILPFMLTAALILVSLMTHSGDKYSYGHGRFSALLMSQLGVDPAGTTASAITLFPATLAVGLLLLVIFALFPFYQWLTQKIRRPDRQDRRMRGRALKFLRVATVIGFLAFIIELQPIALSFLHSILSVGWMASIAGSSLLSMLFADKILIRLRAMQAAIGVALYGILGILALWVVFLWLMLQMKPIVGQGWPVFYIVTVAIALWAYTTVFVDMNFVSIHKFYRDKLVAAFVSQATKDDDEKATQDKPVPKLSQLDSTRSPYHLINAAINVDQPNREFRSGRMSSFFTFSKRYCGGTRTGYCRTKSLEQVDPHVDVGTAMAISGAAVAPNMGKNTVPVLAFIMAMLNIRLNYWLPNPRQIAAHEGKMLRGYWLRLRRPGPVYLVREMLRWLSARDVLLNLSDGGHIENLGLYELLRRQCRLIIVGDAECDPTLSFDGLAEAIRLARIDFGFQIEMDGLDEIRSGDQQFAIGRIRYAPDPENKTVDRMGILIYLKSNLGGDYNLRATLAKDNEDFYRTSADRDDDALYDDNAYVAHYRDRNPDFPHESTADQFFDEAQFESYRALGFQVAASALSAPWVPPQSE